MNFMILRLGATGSRKQGFWFPVALASALAVLGAQLTLTGCAATKDHASVRGTYQQSIHSKSEAIATTIWRRTSPSKQTLPWDRIAIAEIRIAADADESASGACQVAVIARHPVNWQVSAFTPNSFTHGETGWLAKTLASIDPQIAENDPKNLRSRTIAGSQFTSSLTDVQEDLDLTVIWMVPETAERNQLTIAATITCGDKVEAFDWLDDHGSITSP